jgi:iron complex outermembrane recepter protein
MIGLAATFCGPATFAQSATVPVAQLSEVTVTGTREKAPLAETPVSIGTIATESIRQTRPLHPAQLLGQIPGVAVAVTNGEGHTTAIRQPFTTSPVYLFLEDGIPVRATGFFNHNALYEVNIPMAGGIEVIRGPGTALHGSDAIGGIVNILSAVPLEQREFGASLEMGDFGTRRFMASAGQRAGGSGAVRLDFNHTHTDGWRQRTSYDRHSANLRWDHRLSPQATLKTIVGCSKIDQQTGANSALPLADYLHSPTRNNFSIAYRAVEALRISVEYEWQRDATMFSAIPYFRSNRMELNPTFTLSSDPRIEVGQNLSYGALLKLRKNFPSFLRARLIAGLDLDYSPGSRREDNLLISRSGTGANTVYSAYTIATRIYDYDVTFHSASPYLHTELSPLPGLRVTAGLRYDAFGFELNNRIQAVSVPATVLGASRHYGQSPDTTLDYTRLSPKLGATYSLTRRAHVYASFNHGFRGPSESQVFRAGHESTPASAATRARLALGLRQIKAAQIEAGLRGDALGWNYNLVAYRLVKRDDLVSQRDLATNVSTSVNAGKTEHLGLELGLGRSFGAWRLDTALSRAHHEYVHWQTATADFSSRAIESAPGFLGNTRLTWTPLSGTMLQAEWVRIGSYWLEAGNSPVFGKYPGHDLYNLRASHALTKQIALFARAINLLDKRFAESASVSSNTPVFSPGLPRAFYAGIEARW